MARKTWSQAFRDATASAVIVAAAAAALIGARESGSAIAPLNAISHVLWGERAVSLPLRGLLRSQLGRLKRRPS